MSTTVVAKVPSPAAVLARYPLSPELARFVETKTEALRRIIDGRDPRKILIVGPCSADFEDSLVEYARRLSILQERVRDRIEIVMRFYTGKPRTVGGWKGLSHSEPGAHPNVADGIPNSRRIALRLLGEGVALADEMLHPQLAPFFSDILSWQAVGARSTENQYHREVASGLDCPVGFKNPTGGSLKVMGNSVEAARKPTHYVALPCGETPTLALAKALVARFLPWVPASWRDLADLPEIATSGNPWAHGILRGGDDGPNFSLAHVEKWLADVALRGDRLKNPSLIVDCSHENCAVSGKKDFARQADILAELSESILPALSARGLTPVKGFMLESYLLPGNSSFLEGHNLPLGEPGSKRGLSLTDPCLSWEQTQTAVLRLAGALGRTAAVK